LQQHKEGDYVIVKYPSPYRGVGVVTNVSHIGIHYVYDVVTLRRSGTFEAGYYDGELDTALPEDVLAAKLQGELP